MPATLLDNSDHYRAVAAALAFGHAQRAGTAANMTGPTVSAAGAIDPNQLITYLSVDSTKAYTLADGTEIGQIVIVLCIAGTNTPNGTVTPAHTSPASGATYTAVSAFGAVNDFCVFMWDGTGWLRLFNSGVTVS
jgi:hypothetical protein